MDERRSIGERLEGAQRAGDLRLRRRRSDIDLIIASGFAEAKVDREAHDRAALVPGLLLHRLVSAFEAIDTSNRVQCHVLDRKEQRRRVLIRLDLPMLNAATAEVLKFALVWGPKRGYPVEGVDVPWIVRRSVQVFLDDVCDDCHGTKVIGVYGGVQPTCKLCKGTGTRSSNIGRGDAETDFAMWLSQEMGQMVDEADAQVVKELHSVDRTKAWLSEQTNGQEYVTSA